LHRLVAILNPQADRGRTAQLAESLRSALGVRFDLQLSRTTERGEATGLAREAALQGCDAVVAIGGDGTVHEVMNGLMSVAADGRPKLAIVPAGSGNDIAFAIDITGDFQRSAEIIERGATRLVDIGEVRASAGRTCYCINNVGLLLEGEINRTSHRLTWPRGSGLYIRAMLQTLMRRPTAAELKLTIDGQELSRKATILSVANGPRSGGKFQLMPEAAIDDARFDYFLARPVNRLRLLWNVRRALAGKRLEGPWIEQGRFSQMAIHSDLALVAHVDGEPWIAPGDGVHVLEIEVLPQALAVLCP
jgi:diacylglycerol kinase (ATP)